MTTPQKLAAMLVAAGIFTVGGVNYLVSTPQPATRSMLDLKDAGILLGQPAVCEGPERTTPQTRRRVNKAQPGALRPKQVYARIARTCRCFGDAYLDGGFGNCVRIDGGSMAPYTAEVQEWRYNDVTDGGNLWLRTDGLPVSLDDGGTLAADRRNDGGYFTRVVNDPRQPDIVIPSLRRDLVGIDLDASIPDEDGGDSEEVDDSLQFRTDDVTLFHCNQFDAFVDAGTRVNPFANRFCGNLNRLAVQPLPNMIPDCRGPDGGWDDEAGEPGHIAAPNCKFKGPWALPDGGPRWAGCNSLPREYAVGPACLPVESSVVAGDLINQEWLQ